VQTVLKNSGVLKNDSYNREIESLKS